MRKVPSSVVGEILLRATQPPHTLEKFYWFFMLLVTCLPCWCIIEGYIVEQAGE
jgi:hypothetical protein